MEKPQTCPGARKELVRQTLQQWREKSGNKALGKALFTRASGTGINHHVAFGLTCPNPREEGAKLSAVMGIWCGGRTSPRNLQFQQE